MTSLRYHVLSIVAVFAALAIGLVLGSTGLSDRLVSVVSSRHDATGGPSDGLRAERDALVAEQRAADGFAARVGPTAVRGALPDTAVTLVSVGGDPADADAVSQLVGQAGGTLAGQVRLTPAVTDPGRADELRDLASRLLPAGAQLPAATDPGSLAGGLLGSALLTPSGGSAPTPVQTRSVLAGLTAAGFAEPGPAPTPGSLVVVLTGGTADGVDAASVASTTAHLATELDRRGRGAVLAGRTGSADQDGPVRAVRGDPGSSGALSTVDDVQSGSGRVATILALHEQAAGRAGQYGSGPDASGAVPSPQP